MLKMCPFVFQSGRGNSIFWSMRPGRMRAGSRLSIRFVAMMTLTSHRRAHQNVQLIQKLRHGTLKFSGTATRRVVAFASHRIDFINEPTVPYRTPSGEPRNSSDFSRSSRARSSCGLNTSSVRINSSSMTR
uniref:Uncharacterized protein n=1 Tax=Pseudo-nitzschia australis TaxID=44445 RepID=A0A7S4AHU3_9STRA